jgi:hypothetical protein
MEDAQPGDKRNHYSPVMAYGIQKLKHMFPEDYGSGTALDILYEWCEFNKVLKAIYTPFG